MARFMLLWEYDTSRCPLDPKEKVHQWLGLTEVVKKQLKSGEIRDWAHFGAESAGYVIVDGDETDVLKVAGTFVPYVKYTAKTLLNIEQCEKVWKSMTGTA
jgi:hypothetical protein